MSDFYNDAARKQYGVLQAARSRLVADLEEHRIEGNEYAAAESIQELAAVEQQMDSLQKLHSRYNQQQSAPPPMSDQEFMALSPERMANNPEAVEAIFQKSKYYSKDQWSDPEVAGRVRAGMAEVERRRKMGQ